MNRRKFIVLSSLAAMPAGAGQAKEHDGRYWREQTPGNQVSWVIGYMEGALGVFGALMKYSTDPKTKSFATQMIDLFAQKTATYGDLSDQLTKFYEDPANRSILMSDITLTALKRLKGAPASDIDDELADLRRKASAPK